QEKKGKYGRTYERIDKIFKEIDKEEPDEEEIKKLRLEKQENRDVDPGFNEPLVFVLQELRQLIQRGYSLDSLSDPEQLRIQVRNGQRNNLEDTRKNLKMHFSQEILDKLEKKEAKEKDQSGKECIVLLDDKKKIESSNEVIEFFLLNRDMPFFADLEQVVGSINLGKDTQWFRYRRPIDIGDEKLEMLSDMRGKVVSVDGVTVFQEKLDDWARIRAEDSRMFKGITNDKIAVFWTEEGNKVELTFDDVTNATKIEENQEKYGIHIENSIIQGHTILSRGSDVTNSVLNNVQGEVNAINVYIETTTAPILKALNSVVYKVIDKGEVEASNEVVADMYRPALEKLGYLEQKVRVRVTIDYDPQAKVKDPKTGKEVDQYFLTRAENNGPTLAQIRDMPCERKKNDAIENRARNEVLKQMGLDKISTSSPLSEPVPNEATYSITAQAMFDVSTKYNFAKPFAQEFRDLGEDLRFICQYLKDSGKILGPPEGFNPLTLPIAYHKEGRMQWAENLIEKDAREAIQALTRQNKLHFTEETIITHIKIHESKPTEEEAIRAQVEEFKIIKVLFKEFKRIIEEKGGAISGLELFKIALNNMRKGRTELKGAAGELVMVQLSGLIKDIKTVRSGRGRKVEFKRDNLAYRALVEIVRLWPKIDLHRHISNSLSAEFINDMFQKKTDAQKEQIMERVKKLNEAAKEEAKKDATIELTLFTDDMFKDLEELRRQITYKSDREGFSKGAIRDVVLLSSDDFEEAVCNVAKECFADGVVYFELRFNPFKDDLRDLKGYSKVDVINKVLLSVKDGLKKVEDEFTNCRADMIFSFNRGGKFKDDVQGLEEIIR
ncbi:MAG: hypothetical protein KJ710_03795, partial [Candidatus Omnitrophica bacterium]|nr:hypothetical protein [Candidatus Omnitrophota bacterium]